MHLTNQLWRNLWGLETPPCLVNTSKSKSELWSFDRDKGKKSKEIDRSLQRALNDTTEAVSPRNTWIDCYDYIDALIM